MISYSQNFEDVMLHRVFRDRTDGFYVDVGAADPVNLSVTKWFYDLGWSGINIEPHLEFFQKLEAERPRDINLSCGAGATDGEAMLHEYSTKEWSSFATNRGASAPAGPMPIASRPVPVCTLNTILDQHAGGRRIDFLKIDVEGWEKEVLRGIDLRRHRPTIILVEAVDRDTHVVNSDWEDILLGTNYKQVYFDGLNKFYADAKERGIKRHFAVPPNVFDDYQVNIQVEQQKQIVTLTWIVEHSDEDRAAHLAQIHELTDMIKASEADRAARLDQIHVLTEQINSLRGMLTESESDRAARLDGINRLTAMLQATEADRSERLQQIQLLAGKVRNYEARHGPNRESFVAQQIEILKSMLKTLEADRAARLEQVHQLSAWLKECNAERSARLEQVHQMTAALNESNAERSVRLEQVNQLTASLKECDADRAARLEQVNQLTASLKECDADRAARLEQVNQLTASLKECDADRAARLEQVNQLTASLKECDADRAARLEQVNQLTAWLNECDADRSARLEQVEQLTAWLQECNAERTAQYNEGQRLAGLLAQSEQGRLVLAEQYRRVTRIGPILLGLSSEKK